jgi:hypothetical protein
MLLEDEIVAPSEETPVEEVPAEEAVEAAEEPAVAPEAPVAE